MTAQRTIPLALGTVGLLGLVLALVLLAGTGGGGAGSTAAAAGEEPAAGSTGVQVAGEGTVTGRPDVLRLTVGVEVTEDSVDEALRGANEAAARVIDAMRERGVAAEDLQTAGLSVYSRYDDRGRQITGYVVSESVTVELRDLDAAGETIGAAVTAGGDAARLHGVRFALEDDAALLADARARAFAQAREKAEQYADLAGRDLGPVLSIREDVQSRGPQPPQPLAVGDAAAESAAAVPIEAGSTEVVVRVDVRFGLQ